MKNKVMCFDLPSEGRFQLMKEYEAWWIIDAIVVKDDEGNEYSYEEHRFLWYFRWLKSIDR